jgi:hypothetical protein
VNIIPRTIPHKHSHSTCHLLRTQQYLIINQRHLISYHSQPVVLFIASIALTVVANSFNVLQSSQHWLRRSQYSAFCLVCGFVVPLQRNLVSAVFYLEVPLSLFAHRIRLAALTYSKAWLRFIALLRTAHNTEKQTQITEVGRENHQLHLWFCDRQHINILSIAKIIENPSLFSLHYCTPLRTRSVSPFKRLTPLWSR